jgi:Cu(I)/Ag(I) efflux system protein CusF
MKVAMYAFMINLSISTAAIAQSDMKGMDMKSMGENTMSKGTKKEVVHATTGVVKNVDPKDGTVTLADEPVKSLSWPAMTMTFKLENRELLNKFAIAKKADVQFVQQGKNYVITMVK